MSIFLSSPILQFTPTSAGDPISCQKGGRCGSGSQTKKAEFTICRSLLYVNEHFSVKPNAADAPLSQEIIGESPCKPYHLDEPQIES